MTKKRLFVAIELPEELRIALSNAMMESPAEDIRWTPPENLHITLLFIGDTQEEQIPAIKKSLKKGLSGIEPFYLSFSGYKIIYKKKQPVMVWGVFDFPEAYKKLAEKLHQTCQISAKHDPYPHVTLTRIKKKTDLSAEKLKPFEEIRFHDWKISGFSLFESVLTAERPYYKVLDHFNF